MHEVRGKHVARVMRVTGVVPERECERESECESEGRLALPRSAVVQEFRNSNP
jgi:hypothetical protein